VTSTTLTLKQAQAEILAIVARVATQNLPRWTETKGNPGEIWFKDRSHGWPDCENNRTNPEGMASRRVWDLFDAEAAGREFARRAAAGIPVPEKEARP